MPDTPFSALQNLLREQETPLASLPPGLQNLIALYPPQGCLSSHLYVSACAVVASLTPPARYIEALSECEYLEEAT